jgi:hypothetical protein
LFVLCAGRCGSTLLRFLLDAHPDLACPPETELPALCAQFATVWSVLDRPDQAGGRGQGPAETVVAGMRQALDLMIGRYLTGRGKTRYCDKSLGSARHADLLIRLYPEARFVCLYRHPMDMIASGLEACPWGLNSYGFEHYISASPTNMVAAITRYWADHTAAILSVEERYPERCHRVRYEELVSDPEAVTAGLHKFAGVPHDPGALARVFSHDRERFGRSDFKIWNTSKISTESIGRGWSVPVALIPQPLLGTVNTLIGKLGYRPVDQAWGTEDRPADMLAVPLSQPGGDHTQGGDAPAKLLLGDRILAGLSRVDDEFARRWGTLSAESFQIVASTPQGGTADGSWLIDLSARSVIPVAGGPCGAAWRASGAAQAWQQVISDGTNLGVSFRRGLMRYSDDGSFGPGSAVADTRVAMMAELLGITAWPTAAPEWSHP